MRAARIFSFILVFFIAFSVWTPAPALALSSSPTSGSQARRGLDAKKETRLATIRIKNYTGGTMTLRLVSATRSYTFTASKRGTNIFRVVYDTYTVSLTSSTCSGQFSKTRYIYPRTSLGSWTCSKLK